MTRNLVLYVDDDPETLESVEAAMALVEKGRLRVISLDSPDEVLRVAGAFPLVAVVADQIMPGMSGVDLLTRVREINPNATLILTPGVTSPDLERRAKAAGIHYVIPKPWDPAKLIRLLSKQAGAGRGKA